MRNEGKSPIGGFTNFEAPSAEEEIKELISQIGSPDEAVLKTIEVRQKGNSGFLGLRLTFSDGK